MIQVLGLVLATGSFASPVGAQLVPPPPELNPIPAPLPPPPQPPVVNGPLTEGQQLVPRAHRQRRLETQSDRITRCLDEGAGYGLRGGKLDAYSRRCANAH
jgi:hypothetical protein